jgi:hypothetical protein
LEGRKLLWSMKTNYIPDVNIFLKNGTRKDFRTPYPYLFDLVSEAAAKLIEIEGLMLGSLGVQKEFLV